MSTPAYAALTPKTNTGAASEDLDTPQFRPLPSSIETEQALLGAVLVNNEAYHAATEVIDPEHFYEPLHGKIFETVGRLIEKGRVATPLNIATYLEGDPVLAEVGGPAYLGGLAAAATVTINVADYAHSIFDIAVRRGLIGIGEDMINRAHDSDVDNEPSGQIVDAEQLLYELSEKGKYGAGATDLKRALQMALDNAEAAYKRDGGLSGTATGFTDLDRRLGGLQKSDLVILAARPAMGKTSLATNMAFNIAKAYRASQDVSGKDIVEDGGRVLFFSLEMSADQLAMRMLGEQSSVPSKKIRDGTINRDDFERLAEAMTEIQHVPLNIDDTGGLSISALASRARRMARKPGVDLIIIDYLQLLQGSGKKRNENRVQEMTEITTSLKALAKELAVPIIALSQLSRAVESRDDKRPQLADLRESGSIEQDADIVMFIYREEYYHDQKRPGDTDTGPIGGDIDDAAKMENWIAKKERIQNLAEVIVAKHRHGPTGAVTLHFDPELTRFHNYIGNDHLPGGGDM